MASVDRDDQSSSNELVAGRGVALAVAWEAGARKCIGCDMTIDLLIFIGC